MQEEPYENHRCKGKNHQYPHEKAFRIAFAVQDHSLNVLVKISTDEGLWGISEGRAAQTGDRRGAATVLEAC